MARGFKNRLCLLLPLCLLGFPEKANGDRGARYKSAGFVSAPGLDSNSQFKKGLWMGFRTFTSTFVPYELQKAWPPYGYSAERLEAICQDGSALKEEEIGDSFAIVFEDQPLIFKGERLFALQEAERSSERRFVRKERLFLMDICHFLDSPHWEPAERLAVSRPFDSSWFIVVRKPLQGVEGGADIRLQDAEMFFAHFLSLRFQAAEHVAVIETIPSRLGKIVKGVELGFISAWYPEKLYSEWPLFDYSALRLKEVCQDGSADKYAGIGSDFLAVFKDQPSIFKGERLRVIKESKSLDGQLVYPARISTMDICHFLDNPRWEPIGAAGVSRPFDSSWFIVVKEPIPGAGAADFRTDERRISAIKPPQ